jgi:integrase/recombinase XerD
MTKRTENKGQDEKLCEKPGKHRARGFTHPVSPLHKPYSESFREYLKVLKRSPATIATYTYGLNPFFAFLDTQGVSDLRSVRRRDIQAYHTHLLDGGHYTLHSIHILTRSVRRFYDFLEKTGKVLMNPADGIDSPALGDRLPRDVLTLTEIKNLLDTPDTSKPVGVKNKAILEVLYSTGIRVGELCALTIYDVDTREGFLRVNLGKGAKDRVVPIGYKAQKYVAEYLGHVRGKQTIKNRDERALFINRNGNPVDRQNVQLLVKAVARSAGIKKKVTPHTIRHTCATHMVADGADIVHVQHLLGHESLDTTQIYTRVARREVKATHSKTHPREKDKE